MLLLSDFLTRIVNSEATAVIVCSPGSNVSTDSVLAADYSPMAYADNDKAVRWTATYA